MKRDEFLPSIKKDLQLRAGNHCSNPACMRLTSGPALSGDGSIRVGIAAHITAAAEGGPRYNFQLSSEERSSINNGIWLCCNCATLIDKDFSSYPESLLNNWKALAEKKATEELHGIKNGIECPHCNSIISQESRVCSCCKAEKVIGGTRHENGELFKMGCALGGAISFLLFIALPEKLNSSFFFGVPHLAIISSGIITISLGFALIHLHDKWRRRQMPRFFRPTIV